VDDVNLLTELEAAKVARVSRWTIRRLIDGGHLPAMNFGLGGRKVYRVRPEDLLHVQPVQPPAPRERGRRRNRVVALSSKAWPPPRSVSA
jgi:excisionase family DNA binding protein